MNLSQQTVIFLDFDGVLHPAEYLRFDEIDGELILGSDIRFCWASVLWNLIKDHDCDLVIHSSWRTSFDLKEIREMLPQDLRSRVRDVTGDGTRYASIAEYVAVHQLCKYLILDDAPRNFLGFESPCDLQFRKGIDCPGVQDQIVCFLCT
ncbi:MAG: hypothetical protein HT580_17040 [Dechloromonas sp.]|nr:MAG: hypothetical protein HT580_17040 [Dechloromonas sp.]